MRYDITILLAGLIFALLVAACGGIGDDGFDGPASGETTELRGRLLQADSDEPARHTAVYLHRDGERVGRTVTDDTGRFAFESIRAGRHRLAANDGRGHGLLDQRVLFSGGSHDVGVFELRPFPEIPGAVDSHGIGYEERVTTGRGNWHDPVYSSSRDEVYAFRKVEGPEPFDLVRVDTSTGEQDVLLEDLVYSGDGHSRRPLALADDRYLTFIRRTDDGVGRVVYDVHEREPVFDSLAHDLEARYLPSIVLTSNGMVFALVADEEEVTEWDGSGTARSSAEKLRFVYFDFDTGEPKVGPWVEPTWVTGFEFRESTDRMITYSALEPCRGDSSEFTQCTSNDWSDHYLDLENGEMDLIIRTDPSSRRAPDSAGIDLPAEGRSMFVQSPEYLPPDSDQERPATKITRFDPDEHDAIAYANDRWKVDPCEGCSSPAVDVLGAPPTIYVWMSENRSHADRTPHDLFTIDPDTGDRKALNPQIEVDGRTIQLCERACLPYAADDTTFRVEHLFERKNGDWWVAMVDYRGAEVVDRRVFDIWEEGGDPARFDDDVHTASDSDVEAMRLRRGDTGFFQYVVRRSPGAPDVDTFVRRTYLPAHHEYAAFTPDGRALFYFTRDPVSGFDQLFRLRLDTLPPETLGQASPTTPTRDE